MAPDGLSGNDTMVFECLRRANHPLGAYEILARLRPMRPQIAPPTVYRALARLSAKGLARRVETLNAWMSATDIRPNEELILAVCDDCHQVFEFPHVETIAAVRAATTSGGFRPSRQVIEVHGRCGSCDTSDLEHRA